MNQKIRKILIISALVIGTTLPALAQERIATVDLRKVFDGYWKTKQANAAIKERGAEMEAELQALVADFETAKEEYQKLLESASDQAVSITEREKRKKAADQKLRTLQEDERTIQQFQRTARTTVEEQQRRMRENILEEVMAVITSKSKAGNFTMVFDTAAESANRTKIILYTTNPNDLTTAVLTQLNATAPLDMDLSAEESE